MLSLSQNDIQLKQSASNKQLAIKALASSLTSQGLVDVDYVQGMLAREAQSSTFLGNGIAIPHGTTDTRELVKHTGVQVHHFPQGVDWGEGKTVYLAIGIAAKSDEHLGILKQLTRVISASGVEENRKNSKNAEIIIAILNGDTQLEAEFDHQLIQLGFPATDLIQLTTVAADLIKNCRAAGKGCVADAIAAGPTYLGQGLWIAKNHQDVMNTAVSFVTPAQAFTEETIEGASQAFKTRNSRGLHACPGAILVNEAKKFSANILVANLNGDGKTANAKSLMKVITLGVKQGHELQFTAQGDDAERALKAIGQAIANGLGVGV